MKRSDWIIWVIGAALLTLVLLTVSGCRTSYEAEGATHATASDSQDTQGRIVTESTTTAPVRIVTETTTAAGVRRVRTVDLAPVVSTTTSDVKSQERSDSTLDEQHSEKRTFDFLHGPLALVGGLVLVAVVVYVVFRALKAGVVP